MWRQHYERTAKGGFATDPPSLPRSLSCVSFSDEPCGVRTMVAAYYLERALVLFRRCRFDSWESSGDSFFHQSRVRDGDVFKNVKYLGVAEGKGLRRRAGREIDRDGVGNVEKGFVSGRTEPTHQNGRREGRKRGLISCFEWCFMHEKEPSKKGIL